MAEEVAVIPGGLPRVSLVTPSYNAAPYLAAAIESVLSQSYPDIEYLVMDGGSTDGTVELLKGYGDRVRWVSAKDDGQADAIARGFELTTGSVLGWLNADDVLKPGGVASLVDALRSRPDAALAYGDADFIDARGAYIASCTVVEPFNRQRLLHYGDYIIQPAALFTRSAYLEAGGLDRGLNWAMDWDLWLKLSRRHSVVYLPRPVASYRWLGSNKTAEGGLARLREVEVVARRHGLSGLPAYFRLELARFLAVRSGESLLGLRLVEALADLRRAAAAVCTSREAVASVLTRHVWRNYRTARVLARRAESMGRDGHG